jgi:hypothetical protein
MKKLLPLISLALFGCSPEPTMNMDVKSFSDGSVSVERIAVISDALAYDGRRGVYRIKDNRTGQEFIGVSGVGISELGSHIVGKTQIQDER